VLAEVLLAEAQPAGDLADAYSGARGQTSDVRGQRRSIGAAFCRLIFDFCSVVSARRSRSEDAQDAPVRRETSGEGSI
jgi:hypothetical protein